MNAIDLATAPTPSVAVKVFLLLTLLSVAPALVLSVTSFLRIVIVLSFLRQALGAPQLPPNQVIIGLALFLTFFVMTPTLTRVHDDALAPYLDDRIDHAEAGRRAIAPLSEFMLSQVREQDVVLFLDVGGRARPTQGESVPPEVLVPAFMVSELTRAFQMGLTLFIPLLLIDLVVAAVLMSLGMMMVPPTMISLPLKLAVFVLADGWHLVVASLARSFQ